MGTLWTYLAGSAVALVVLAVALGVTYLAIHGVALFHPDEHRREQAHRLLRMHRLARTATDNQTSETPLKGQPVNEEISTERRLARDYAATLQQLGHIIQPYHSDDERDRIRRAGRAAGRILQRPVRTLDRDRAVHIVLDDWEDNPLQRQLSDIRIRKNIDRVFPYRSGEQ